MAHALCPFGAPLCGVNAYGSIAFIVLAQLGYAIGLPCGREK
jgi:hypothetical protein